MSPSVERHPSDEHIFGSELVENLIFGHLRKVLRNLRTRSMQFFRLSVFRVEFAEFWGQISNIKTKKSLACHKNIRKRKNKREKNKFRKEIV